MHTQLSYWLVRKEYPALANSSTPPSSKVKWSTPKNEFLSQIYEFPGLNKKNIYKKLFLHFSSSFTTAERVFTPAIVSLSTFQEVDIAH